MSHGKSAKLRFNASSFRIRNILGAKYYSYPINDQPRQSALTPPRNARFRPRYARFTLTLPALVPKLKYVLLGIESATVPYIHFRLKTIFTVCWLWLLVTAASTARAQILYIGAFGDDDYVANLLRSALKHTEDKYGKVELNTRLPASTTREQSMVLAEPNAMRLAMTASVGYYAKNPEFIVLPVPLMRGIVGYRICFSSPDIAEDLNTIDSLEKLQNYTFGVGNDWYDRKILDANQLKNVGVGYNFLFDDQVASLFNMTALKRVDILCRGINEAYGETTRYDFVKKTVLNQSFALHYSIPFFMYMHKNNQKLKDRLVLGFDIINKNGEFQKIWEKEFLESVQFANMNKRKIIELKGGSEEFPIETYEQFLYKP